MSTTPLSPPSTDDGTHSEKIRLSHPGDSSSLVTEVSKDTDSSFNSVATSIGSHMDKAQRRPRTRALPQVIDLKTPLSDKGAIKKRSQNIIKLIKALEKKKKIVVIAGAGISVGAGIPDFRSSAGLFSTLRTEYKLKSSGKELFDANVYRADGSTKDFHDMIRNLHALVDKAKPTIFHQLLASLSSQGRLLRLYTQNVDGIETKMDPLKTQIPLSRKAPWPKTIQLHGALEKMVCSRCKWMSDLKPELFSGPEAPDCPECEEMDGVREVAGKRTLGIGKLRPRMVLYNEENPDADAIGAVTKADLKSRPDVVLVVGTSLRIPGVRRIVREMCGTTQDVRGGLTVWINEDDPPSGKEFENIFDLIVKGNCETVAKIANLPRFDGTVSSDPLNNPLDTFLIAFDAKPEAAVPVAAPECMADSLATPSASPQPLPAKNARKRKLTESQMVEKPAKKARKAAPSAAQHGLGQTTNKRKATQPVAIEKPANKTRKFAPKKPKAESKRKANAPKVAAASVDKLFRAAKSAPNTACKRSCSTPISEGRPKTPVLQLQETPPSSQSTNSNPYDH